MSGADRPLRIAEVVRPAAGGMRRHLATLLAGLDRSRFLSTLFAPPDFMLEGEANAVPRVTLAIRPTTHPFADLRSIGQLAQHLRGNFDLVHAHGLRVALIGVLAAQRAGLPALFTAHNLLTPLSPLPRRIFAHIGHCAAAVIAVSQAVADTLVAAGVTPEKITVIPNGIDLTPFDAASEPVALRTNLGLPAETLLVVAVGRLAPEKGFDVLLQAFPRVVNRCPQARLLLVGGGPLEADLRELAARSSASHAIKLAGSQAEVVPYFQAADVIAIPSRQEGQGIVALEAMAARKPVVAGRVGGLVETIIPEETGLLFPSEDADALADALLILLTDAARRQQMGIKGRARVEQEYTAAQMVARTEALFVKTAGYAL